MLKERDAFVSVARFEELQGKGSITVHPNGKTLVLFLYSDKVYALDNRCPHMGFPLDKGSVEDGILSCHWHHARFDLASGGAFDLWADDIDSFPVELRDGEIYVDLRANGGTLEHQRNRLRDGLQHNLSLVVAKAVINLLRQGVAPAEPFRIGLDFGTLYRGMGWGRGLTTLGCTINLVPYLDADDRPLALFHGLADVASDTAGMSPRFNPRPLPNDETDIPTLKAWFRQFVEVRDAQAGERAIVSALRAGADDVQIADMLFTAATDHRYLDAGHTLDFINKALTSVDLAGWEHAELAFTSVVPNLTDARRMEESNAWRKPIDLIPLLEAAFEKLPEALETGTGRVSSYEVEALLPTLLGDDPAAIIDLLLNCLREGVAPVDLAGIVAYAAARRIAHFHTSNEFGDWDTALHTFTFANAAHQGLARVESIGLTRGIFDAAMSIYLDRFLNLPSVRLPQPDSVSNPIRLLDDFAPLLNLQQQVNQAGALAAQYLVSGGCPEKLMARMGQLLLREDRDFHTIQCVEAAFNQYSVIRRESEERANHVLIAAARYLAAHAPTMRSQLQTYTIARRLSHGENLFEE
ncbi:MAG: Rieske 2Fe-2S domain-containing protein [Chloroflexota bacterium]|nr:Rieske 2Fe-2S domain-containing protein [Chloroflexota bacterium]MDE2907896.1 Rieske 2Fe-2S domain-containing protein [Chloroflexota bacterium]